MFEYKSPGKMWIRKEDCPVKPWEDISSEELDELIEHYYMDIPPKKRELYWEAYKRGYLYGRSETPSRARGT